MYLPDLTLLNTIHYSGIRDIYNHGTCRELPAITIKYN